MVRAVVLRRGFTAAPPAPLLLLLTLCPTLLGVVVVVVVTVIRAAVRPLPLFITVAEAGEGGIGVAVFGSPCTQPGPWWWCRGLPPPPSPTTSSSLPPLREKRAGTV